MRPTDQDWAIRAGIYRFVVDHARVPSTEEIAAEFAIEPGEAREALYRLHAAHALYFDAGSDRIRMLNPFSGVQTPYRVETGGKTYDANCAWDMLGIPAMLGQDALIHATLEIANKTVEIPVVDGRPRPDRDYVVNFSVQFRHWYDDLIHT
ncbi:hypothetical protein BH23CHL2_BH23CHL2_32500 [soil metagenome]